MIKSFTLVEQKVSQIYLNSPQPYGTYVCDTGP